MYYAFIDFEKYFDELERSFIFEKLVNTRADSKFIKGIQCMYSTVKAVVRYNERVSHLLK
jgi:hypothetical protein